MENADIEKFSKHIKSAIDSFVKEKRDIRNDAIKARSKGVKSCTDPGWVEPFSFDVEVVPHNRGMDCIVRSQYVEHQYIVSQCTPLFTWQGRLKSKKELKNSPASWELVKKDRWKNHSILCGEFEVLKQQAIIAMVSDLYTEECSE